MGRTWYVHRKFSQQIRLVLGKGEGALAEGKRLCNEQMDKALEQLASDPDFCTECAPSSLLYLLSLLMATAMPVTKGCRSARTSMRRKDGKR